MQNFIELLIYALVIFFVWKLIFKRPSKFKHKLSDEEYLKREFMRVENTIHAEEFGKKFEKLKRKGFEGEGIYIFTNLKNNKKYVGQSVNLLNRVNGHLKGKGNPDLHLDMQKGDKFTIQFMKLKDSEFNNLDAFEKHYIYKLNSYHVGYNKTRGNH